MELSSGQYLELGNCKVGQKRETLAVNCLQVFQGPGIERIAMNKICRGEGKIQAVVGVNRGMQKGLMT